MPGASEKTMIPIFDGHVHLIGEDGDEYVASLLRGMDRNNVPRAVVFGMQDDPESPDSLALKAHQRWPDRFVPFASDISPTAADAAEVLDRRLAGGIWHGVGEIFVAAEQQAADYQTRQGEPRQWRYPLPPEGPLSPRFCEVFEVCAKHELPVLAHCEDARVLEKLLARHPRTDFIWGHADWSMEAAGRLLPVYPNLYVEIGTAVHFWALEGCPAVDYMDDWRRCWSPLLEQFQGRITFGSDPFEWRHADTDEHVDCAYSPIRRFSEGISRQAAEVWLWGTLSGLLERKERRDARNHA